MKKALVVFLILAVAGGLFAQVTFSGSVETGIAAKYDAGILTAWASLELYSPETRSDTDAKFRFGVKVPLSILNVAVQGNANSLMTDKTTVHLGEKIDGNIVGLGWYLKSEQDLVSYDDAGVKKDLTANLVAGLSYGIPINDKASATVGGSAKAANILDFDVDKLKFNAYGKVEYNFNGNVSTSGEFGLDNGKRDFA